VFLVDQPPVIAHLTPSFEIPFLAAVMEEARRRETSSRETPLPEVALCGLVTTSKEGTSLGRAAGDGLPSGISNTAGWKMQQIDAKLDEVKKRLDWDSTPNGSSARAWWIAFEHDNKHQTALVLRLAEELANRNATITEFFLAFVYSNTDNIQANLCYLDYTRLKKDEERKKRETAQNTKDATPIRTAPGAVVHPTENQGPEELSPKVPRKRRGPRSKDDHSSDW